MLGCEVRSALDRLVLVDPGDDLLGLDRRVAELLERLRHRLVDDLQVAAADEPLVLDERDVRLDAGRVAIHHEGDGARRRQDRELPVDRKSTRLNSSHLVISYAVFCLKKKKHTKS